jgi:hypothetical protein
MSSVIFYLIFILFITFISKLILLIFKINILDVILLILFFLSLFFNIINLNLFSNWIYFYRILFIIMLFVNNIINYGVSLEARKAGKKEEEIFGKISKAILKFNCICTLVLMALSAIICNYLQLLLF